MLAEEKAIEIRDTIVEEIDAWWTSVAQGRDSEIDTVTAVWNVDQAIQDGNEEPAITGRKIWVGIEPDDLPSFAVDRGHDEVEFPIRVIVFERKTTQGPPDTDWGDERFQFAAKLKEWLSDARRNDWPEEMQGYPPESSEYAFLFDPERYAALNTWVSAFVVTYRGEVTTT